MATTLRKIDPGTKEFIGVSGKKYIIEDQINRKRYMKYLEAQVRLGYNMTFAELFDRFERIYEAVNTQRLNDIAVLSRDAMQAVADITEDREPAIVEMCTLFINEPDEDRTVINNDMIKAKAEDWNDIDMSSFFLLALTFIPRFADVYRKVSQATSLEQEETKS